MPEGLRARARRLARTRVGEKGAGLDAQGEGGRRAKEGEGATPGVHASEQNAVNGARKLGGGRGRRRSA
jgi:hypothetical protein